MLYEQDRAWAEIDLDALERNYRSILACLAPGSRMIAVLKTNAYGLGAAAIGPVLEELGCPMFAVCCPEEAMELRAAGVTRPILLFGPLTPERVPIAIENGLVAMVYDVRQAEDLSRAAGAGKLRAHLKVDAGLSRFGLALEGREQAALEEAKAVLALPGLSVEGIFTHCTAAEPPEGDWFNRRQIALFHRFCDRLAAEGHPLKRHCSASLFTALYPEAHDDFVRVASLLFGVEPTFGRGPATEPVLSLRARIAQVKQVPAGTPVGYGPGYYTLRPTRIAVIPFGYADGLHRAVGGRMEMLVRGRRARQIGKLCMDFCMLDVTDIPEAEAGDIVTLIGRDGEEEASIFDVAALYPGTATEVVTMLGRRIPRFYLRAGEIVGRHTSAVL